MRVKQFWKTKFFWFFVGLFFWGLIVFWQVLSFTFSKDDWGLLWGSLHDASIYPLYAIHPVTPIEFFIFSHIFGTNAILWQLLGIFIRVSIGLVSGYVMFALTKLIKAGIVSSIFVISSFAGIESIHFISGHAAAIAILFLLIGFYVWIRFITHASKNIFYFLVFSCIGFFLDPGRALPYLFIVPLSYIFFSKRKIQFSKIKKHALFVLCSVAIGIVLFSFWYITQSKGSQFVLFLEHVSRNYTFFFIKSYLIGNYFGSIGNVLIGWIIPNVQDAQNTGVYSKVIARFAFVFLLGVLVCSYISYKQKNKQGKVLSFFLLWIFLWYFPDWLFEPRTPMAGTHRYLLISGIGLSMALSYSISLIKNKWLFFCSFVCIVLANVFTIHRILAYQQTFRSQHVFHVTWQAVAKEVAYTKPPYIFVFTGKDPYVGMIAGLTAGIPFALNKGIVSQQNLPLLINDPSLITKYICLKNIPQIGRTRSIMQRTKIPLSHVFAWDITYQKIRSYSLQERVFLKIYAKSQNCYL